MNFILEISPKCRYGEGGNKSENFADVIYRCPLTGGRGTEGPTDLGWNCWKCICLAGWLAEED